MKVIAIDSTIIIITPEMFLKLGVQAFLGDRRSSMILTALEIAADQLMARRGTPLEHECVCCGKPFKLPNKMPAVWGALIINSAKDAEGVTKTLICGVCDDCAKEDVINGKRLTDRIADSFNEMMGGSAILAEPKNADVVVATLEAKEATKN